MSLRRTDYGGTFEMNVGSTKTFTPFIEDENGNQQSFESVVTYATVDVVIYKPDGTVISTIVGSYADRRNGKISFTVPANVATLENAGNWIGEVILKNNIPEVIDQRKFNFNILESY